MERGLAQGKRMNETMSGGIGKKSFCIIFKFFVDLQEEL